MALLVDLNFHSNTECNNAKEIIIKQAPALLFSKYLKNNITFIKHAGISERMNVGKIDYIFFKKSNRIFSIPLKAILHIRKQKPEIILVQGFVFPIQLMLLKALVSSKVKIIVQHHGEIPWNGMKLVLQKMVGRWIDACLFTSLENSVAWKKSGVIRNKCPCFEVQEASTSFQFQDKREVLKEEFKMNGSSNYLWVGRLNSNKDPLTVIQAFSAYYKMSEEARLFMIYQDNTLLPSILNEIAENNMEGIISLVGEVAHDDLEKWYNAADFYISGSHKEGSGYALIEAMACGCIPVVTNIPSFQKITDNGTYGMLYEPGNKNDLLLKLKSTSSLDQNNFSKNIVAHFNASLSYQSIAKDLDKVCDLLLAQ